ncbi:hypothetical protein ONZ43_g6149 [Nemania bipapillata]|uniref:Uncharacterized protein n=1 Tax=Nemania bipapillata TaxID=110536 RepID=A0ACC2I2B4_9PEZI|nr:hypothetical protein ONZ43_g6149 [Nemania bipapillata]
MSEPGGVGTFDASPERPQLTETSVNTSVDQSVSTMPNPSPTPLSNGVPLHIMFLGSPAIRSDKSPDNLELRSPLRDRLTVLGNPVDLVESPYLGESVDKDTEAYTETQIGQIHEYATRIVPITKPNIFILHIGAEHCLQSYDTKNARNRLRDLIVYLFATSPRATVILSTLLTNALPGMEPCVLDMNIQIRKLASALQREGRPVVLAEMHYEQGLPDRPLPADVSDNGTHPSDHGYKLMVDILLSAILEADRRGFLKAPEKVAILGDRELERAREGLVLESETIGKLTSSRGAKGLRWDRVVHSEREPEIIHNT